MATINDFARMCNVMKVAKYGGIQPKHQISLINGALSILRKRRMPIYGRGRGDGDGEDGGAA